MQYRSFERIWKSVSEEKEGVGICCFIWGLIMPYNIIIRLKSYNAYNYIIVTRIGLS
jgi:hypothetical protein